MAITVNQDLLTEDTSSGADKLPDGVFLAKDYPEGADLPEGWVELFRVNDRVYGIKKKLSPGVVFRMMKAIRKSQAMELAMTEMMYDVLGEPVMDVLATENLSDEEFEHVMKAVNKHAGGAFTKILGN